METITAENRIKIALRSKVPPVNHYLAFPGEHGKKSVRQIHRDMNGPYEVNRVYRKIISVTDAAKVKFINIFSVLPMPPRMNDTYLKQQINNIQRLKYVDNWRQCVLLKYY